ncbi:M23 family metallopeptidase [Nocardia implantans]|uniref:M23 family metallopeptidase n=1 Tax=Nocardia implantans TaxID=3108168 RepID=A0ABU6AV96_9NOCA|nr:MULTISPECIES: M23 family metallopeptidase [unclassified Nocardia]MBF6192443.1 M23 family metallopeptidase [Nocardia beijingensis]MEA3527652.1 M23 family metallopeptidase [Nocardia sp. CDC192]MEB3511360.1 M23 family metallopeptidase [Nocardia sp. CDC186]
MPVTFPLPIRRAATRLRRDGVTARVVVASAVVTASFGVLAAAQQDEDTDSARLVAGKIASGEIRPAEGMARFAVFTPPQSPAPQAAPAPVPWDLNRIAQDFARPKTVRPAAGVLTSNFGTRWGAMHAGLDFGDPLGAPIAAVTDGVVIEAGPASGFGLWVRVQQDDGTVGVYGHVNDILATVGQPVRAGDVIATVGNRGYSTGPHLHYEVHLADGTPIDPHPWLAGRGIDVGYAPED